jgi:molecular chaperone GrpE
VTQGASGPHHDAADQTRGSQETAAPGATAADAADPAQQPVPDFVPVEDGSSTAPQVEADLANAKAAVAALTNDVQRLQAEYVNYKRRVDRDRGLVKENATYSVLSSLMPVLDDLDRAREHGELEGGFKAIADSLERIVAGHGLVKYGTPGDEFDPRLHEALMHSLSPDVTTTTCQTIVSAGYRIGERVVRPARVTVVDPAPAQADEATGSTGTAGTTETAEPGAVGEQPPSAADGS